MKPFITITLFCVITVCSFWMGVYSSRAIIIQHQQELLETQKDLKKSLKNQVEYIRLINEAFGETVEIERPGTKERRDEITVEGEE